MQTTDLKTLDGTMTYIVASYLKSMSNIYHTKLNRKEIESDDVELAHRFTKALEYIDIEYSNFIKKDYLISFNSKWWEYDMYEKDYIELKTNSLKAFFKEFAYL